MAKKEQAKPMGYFSETILMIDKKLERSQKMTEKKIAIGEKTINHHLVERTVKRGSSRMRQNDDIDSPGRSSGGVNKRRMTDKRVSLLK